MIKQDSSQSMPDDEIDLKELFKTIWAGRILIFICIFISICIASFYLRNAERKYTVEYLFQPVSEDNGSSRLTGLSSLASLAGVSLPSAESGDFKTFQILLQAEEVAAKLIQDKEIIKKIYRSEWNEQNLEFEEPALSSKGKALSTIKLLLTGDVERDYMPPNAARLSAWLAKNFTISEDRDSGFLKLVSQTSQPKLMLQILTSVTEISDQIIKDRFQKNGRQSVMFYQKKIAASRSRESREALAQLIAQEEQKLMLASNGSFFVARPLTKPTISLKPTSPRASLVLAFSIVLGSFAGAAILFMRKMVKNV